jgi:hypothetical protein
MDRLHCSIHNKIWCSCALSAVTPILFHRVSVTMSEARLCDMPYPSSNSLNFAKIFNRCYVVFPIMHATSKLLNAACSQVATDFECRSEESLLH